MKMGMRLDMFTEVYGNIGSEVYGVEPYDKSIMRTETALAPLHQPGSMPSMRQASRPAGRSASRPAGQPAMPASPPAS